MKSIWQTVEFARNAVHAQKDAKELWARVEDLTDFVVKIETVLREYTEPLDNGVVQILHKALTGSNQVLDKLARKCLNIGDRDNLGLVHRITRPVYFTLSNKSIQKFEHDLQTYIMILQTAFILLNRGESQESIRRIEHLLASFGGDINQIALHKYWDSTRHSDPSPKALRDIRDRAEATTSTTISSYSIEYLVQTATTRETEMPSSPLELLTSQETRAWDSEHRKLSGTRMEDGFSQSECSAAIICAIVNHSPGFQQFVADGIGLEGTDGQGHTPLMHTIFQHGNTCNDCLGYMELLLESKVNANTCNNGESALHLAVRCNHLAAARVLLQRDADIDVSFPNTPLMAAIKGNNHAFVELFLSYRPNLNVMDHNNWGLINHATYHNSRESLLVLLRNNKALALNLDLDACCDMDWTPLMHLAEKAHRPENVSLARILLDYGAEVNTADPYGYTALYYAIKIGAASPQRNKFVQLLLERGANVDDVRSQVSERTMNKFVALRTVASPAMKSRPLQRL